MTNLHAHIAKSAADCDGQHGYDYVAWMTPAEKGDDEFGDLSFKERVLGGIVAFHAEAEVHIHEYGFRYSEPTDEGYSAAEVTWCEDDCADESSVYDQYAEMMGY